MAQSGAINNLYLAAPPLPTEHLRGLIRTRLLECFGEKAVLVQGVRGPSLSIWGRQYTDAPGQGFRECRCLVWLSASEMTREVYTLASNPS